MLLLSLLWLSILLPFTTFNSFPLVTINIIVIVAITVGVERDGWIGAEWVEKSGISGVERDGWGRVGCILVEWWNYISFTFLCIYENHYHNSYLCHHPLRYRCFLFSIEARNIIKTTFDSITTFLFLLLRLSILPPSTTFHSTSFVTMNKMVILYIIWRWLFFRSRPLIS